MQQCTENKNVKAQTRNTVHEMLIDMLENRSNYHITRNAFARILQLKNKESFEKCQEDAENKIFKVFQKEGCEYVQKFRGCGFYMYEKDKIMMVKERNTYIGPTEYKLVPPHSIL